MPNPSAINAASLVNRVSLAASLVLSASPLVGAASIVSYIMGDTDNAIVSGAAFDNWTVDASSYKTAAGLILTQTGTSDNLIYDVPGLAVATEYWMKISTDLKSPGSTGNVRLVALADTGCEIAGTAGALVNFGSAGALGTFYMKVKTGATQAQGGLFRLVLKHATSPDTQVLTTVDGVTDLITLAAHGYVSDQPFKFVAGTPPSGLALGTVYYARDITANTFKVAATAGGAAIDFTGAGVSMTVANWFRVMDVVVYPIPDRSSAKICIVGDRESGFVSATATAVDTAILDQTNGGDAVNCVSPGDMYDGTPTLNSNNDTIKNALIARGGNLYAAPGNWDYTGGIAAWETYFGITAGQSNRYFRRVLGQCEFFFYDSNPENTDNNQVDVAGAKADVMGAWLLAAIASSTAKWKIVVIHHPMYSSSTHHGGPSVEVGWSAAFKSMQWDWSVLGVPFVLNSHDHVVEAILKSGTLHVQYALAGGTANAFGTPIAESLFRSLTSGYVKIHDSPTTLILEFFDTANLMLNRYKISRTG